MKHFFLYSTLFILSSFSLCEAQQTSLDTLRIMSYNTLNYGFASSDDCPALITDNKNIWLKTVVQYMQPDILGLVKMDATPISFTTDTVIQAALDTGYDHTPYTNNSGYEKENMLYFKKSKIGLISTTTIYSGDQNISDINLHRLFYKSPYLATTHDTVFLNIILVHLESGSSSTSERATEIQGAMTWMNSHIKAPGNYIFMGDFNVTSSNEGCFQQLINSTNPDTKFVEPTGQLGDWSNNPSQFALYLTQSPRLNDPGDCGATGGLNDWLDHILCSPYIMQGADSVTYIPGTFHVIGQDGLHTSQDLLAAPQDTVVPSNALNALYYMSSHLPVTLQLEIKTPDTIRQVSNALTNIQAQEGSWQYSHLVYDNLSIRSPGNNAVPRDYRVTIYDMQGRRLREVTFTGTVPVSDLTDGVYILVISRQNLPITSGRFVKVSR